MNLLRNLERKYLMTFHEFLMWKKSLVDLRMEEKHSWLLKKQNTEVKELPGCSQYNKVNKIQGLPWMHRTKLWCPLREAAAELHAWISNLVFTPWTARGRGGMLRAENQAF